MKLQYWPCLGKAIEAERYPFHALPPRRERMSEQDWLYSLTISQMADVQMLQRECGAVVESAHKHPRKRRRSKLRRSRSHI